MRRLFKWLDRAGSTGSIVLEVILAAQLAGPLVVPVANAFVGTVGEARSVRQRAWVPRAGWRLPAHRPPGEWAGSKDPNGGSAVRRARPRFASGGSAGSILLEVVVATLLVGLLVVPLATSFAGMVGEARTVRQRAEGDPAGRTASQSAESWEWGPRVTAGWWRPGPVLHLRLCGATGASSADAEVGLWANGWLLVQETVVLSGRSSPPVANDLQLGPELWTGLADSELVVRVRTAAGAWGPPWRLAVPEPGADTPALGAALSTPPQGPTVVVHRPGIGTSSLAATWSPTDLTSPPFGLLFSLTQAVEGWGGATLDGRSQWWLMEAGRSVDLYF